MGGGLLPERGRVRCFLSALCLLLCCSFLCLGLAFLLWWGKVFFGMVVDIVFIVAIGSIVIIVVIEVIVAIVAIAVIAVIVVIVAIVVFRII